MPLTNSQYENVMRVISERRNISERTLVLHREEINEKLPELSKLLKEITRRGVDAVKRSIAGDEGARKELDDYLKKAAVRKAELLKEGGYPADYLEPHYFCEKCNDTGFLKDGSPCICFKQLSYDLIFSQDRLRKLLSVNNFDNYDIMVYPDEGADEVTGLTPRQTAQKAVETSEKFLTGGEDAPKNLLIYGSPGTGKTYLTHCIAKAALDKGLGVIYLTASEFFDVAEQAEFSHNDEPFENVLNTDLLIIDDLGTELTNGFTLVAIYRIINERLLSGKKIVISTNLSTSDLAECYNERVYSRIAGNYQLIKLIGPDIRLTSKIQ